MIILKSTIDLDQFQLNKLNQVFSALFWKGKDFVKWVFCPILKRKGLREMSIYRFLKIKFYTIIASSTSTPKLNHWEAYHLLLTYWISKINSRSFPGWRCQDTSTRTIPWVFYKNKSEAVQTICFKSLFETVEFVNYSVVKLKYQFWLYPKP